MEVPDRQLRASSSPFERGLELADLPMLGNITKPVDAGGLELGVWVEASGTGGVGREAAGDGARDERGALLLQPLDQGPFLCHQGVELGRLTVEEVGDGAALVAPYRARKPLRALQIEISTVARC